MGGNSGGDAAKEARKEEQRRQQRIREGTERVDNIFGQQFNNDFYTGRREAYLDYATPQLQDQYEDAQRQLTYSLARGGLLDSSARADRLGELQQLYDTNQQQIGDRALSYETDARNSIEDARSSLISQLNATGDVQQAVQGARARADSLSQTPAFDPLVDLFAGFTTGLGKGMAADRANSMARQFGADTDDTGYQGSTARVDVRR